jgi:hypothetical protein
MARPPRRTTVPPEYFIFSTIIRWYFPLPVLAFLVTGGDRRTTVFHRQATITDGEPPPC